VISANTSRAKSKLASILFRDSPGVSFVLILAGWLVAIGFALGNSNNNYDALINLMPFYSWSVLFTIYATAKSYCIIFRDTPSWPEVTVSSVGIWAWSYIFLSFTIYDRVPVAPTEFLLFLPVLAEVWALTSIIYYKNGGGTDGS